MHPNSAGFSIKESNISKLYDYANKELANIDFNEGYYEADFVVNGNCSYLGSLILDLDRGAHLYGQDNPEPIIIVENIIIDPKKIAIMGKNKDTMKIEFNGISYIKFKAQELIDMFGQYKDKVSVTIAGKGNVNEWGGRRTPQIFIDSVEIKEISNDMF